MRFPNIIRMLGLQVFAEGGAGAAGGAGDGGTASGAGVTAGAAAQQTKGVKSNPLASVVYGKQEGSAPAAEVQKTSEPADPAAEFEKLREVTDHYTVPGDVCETYEAVYKTLEEADRIYSA